MSEQGKANGNRLYSSTTVRMYLLHVAEGDGPLKSRFNRSKALVELINGVVSGLKNLGLHSLHVTQELVIFLTSSTENAKLRLRMYAIILVIPGWQSVQCKLYNKL